MNMKGHSLSLTEQDKLPFLGVWGFFAMRRSLASCV